MSTSPDLPEASGAELHVLFEGYVGGRVASTHLVVVRRRPCDAEPLGSTTREGRSRVVDGG